MEFQPANFEKKWLYASAGQPQKRNFSIEKSILGCKANTGKAPFQTNFKFKIGATLIHVTLIEFTAFYLRNYQFRRHTQALQSYNFDLREHENIA